MCPERTENGGRGVSPVVGVVLMVAITVLLASTTAVLVLGLGDQRPRTPTAGFAFEYEAGAPSDALEITHTGGTSVPSDEVYVVVSDARRATGDPNGEYAFHELSPVPAGSDVVAGNRAVVGDRPEIDGSGALDLAGATVRVVWRSSDEVYGVELAAWSE